MGKVPLGNPQTPLLGPKPEPRPERSRQAVRHEVESGFSVRHMAVVVKTNKIPFWGR